MDARTLARGLRVAEGLSARQIGARLGVPTRTVAGWLAGLPVPDWTRRPNAKDGLRHRAVALREAGWSAPDIAREVGVSRSTAWSWVRDLPLARDGARATAGAERRRSAHAAWAAARRADTDRRREAVRRSAAALVGALGRLDLVRIGALIYWCEGTKAQQRNGAGGERVIFTNSDAGLIRVFLEFLRVMGVPPSDLGYRVAIHETADAEAAVRWWAERVSVEPERFSRTTLKRSRPATNRHNTGKDYHGCLVVTVRRGRELYWAIEGIVSEVVRLASPEEPTHAPRP
jgi:transposase